jgi:hypothetical protein
LDTAIADIADIAASLEKTEERAGRYSFDFHQPRRNALRRNSIPVVF